MEHGCAPARSGHRGLQACAARLLAVTPRCGPQRCTDGDPVLSPVCPSAPRRAARRRLPTACARLGPPVTARGSLLGERSLHPLQGEPCFIFGAHLRSHCPSRLLQTEAPRWAPCPVPPLASCVPCLLLPLLAQTCTG